MTPLANPMPEDGSLMFRELCDAIRDANVQAICHDLTASEVMCIWAKTRKDEVDEINATLTKMARLGRE